MINTAVFRRELLDRLRSFRTVASILACALLASLLVWMRWPTDSRLDNVTLGSMQVFGPLAYALAAAIVLLVPAFPATSIVSERRRGTLALLLNSPMSRTEIYLGKLASNFLLAMLIVSVSLPALAACFALGGISVRDQIVPLLLVLVCMCFQFSAVGLWVSSRAASSDASLRWTYAAILMLVVMTLAPSSIIGNVDNVLGLIARWLTQLSPLGALRELTSTPSLPSQLAVADGWPGYCIASVLSGLLLALATWYSLNPQAYDRPKATGVMLHDRKRSGRIFRRMSYLVDPQKRKAGIPRFINPVMVKEFRTRKFGRLHWLLRLVAACGIGSLTITVISATGTVNWGVSRIAGALVLLQTSLLVVLGPSLAAGLIAAERETGGWQLLRMTTLPAYRIVIGKLMSVVWTMGLVLLATLPGYLVMMWIQPSLAPQVQRVLISLVMATLVIVLISAMISAFWKSAVAATATSYGVLLSLFAGTLLVWLARGKPFGTQLVERALLLNPAAAALADMRMPGFEEYSLTPTSWWISLAMCAACLLTLSIRTWQLTHPD